MALRRGKEEGTGRFKGTGQRPLTGAREGEGGGEAEFGRRKGVWRDEDCSSAPPPMLRMGRGDRSCPKLIAVTGLGLGAKGEGETGLFFS